MRVDIAKDLQVLVEEEAFQFFDKEIKPELQDTTSFTSQGCAHYRGKIKKRASPMAAQYMQGLRHWCSMSRILFNLFIDHMILHIKTLLPIDKCNALFTFIDAIALQIKSPHTLHKLLYFLSTKGPLYRPFFQCYRISTSQPQ